MKRRKIVGLDKFEPDKTLERDYQIDEIEALILKPHREGINKLTKDEISEYLNIDTEKLNKINIKLITIWKETQKIINDNLEEILKNITKREKEEKENDR